MRKTPIRHRVRTYTKDNGKVVHTYNRGRGSNAESNYTKYHSIVESYDAKPKRRNVKEQFNSFVVGKMIEVIDRSVAAGHEFSFKLKGNNNWFTNIGKIIEGSEYGSFSPPTGGRSGTFHTHPETHEDRIDYSPADLLNTIMVDVPVMIMGGLNSKGEHIISCYTVSRHKNIKEAMEYWDANGQEEFGKKYKSAVLDEFHTNLDKEWPELTHRHNNR